MKSINLDYLHNSILKLLR